ncbi:MAG TPA: FG-GAP-like repeat-containing protein [Bacillota bacterium]|nr:FG-GAP-like repeat-containing protein [Bacillota bacterium]
MLSKSGKVFLVLIVLLIFNARLVFADPTPTPITFHDSGYSGGTSGGGAGGASTTNQLSKQLLINGIDPFTAQDVDANGAFHYTYPLQLPPGTNGMAPKLNLVYNSNGDNGMLGVGWSLLDIPTIDRDRTFPVTFDDMTDHYIYNGERLLYSDSTSGGDGYWHTKRESYERIQFIDPNTSSSYWVVTQKNGTKLYFGATADSHIDAVGQSGQARLWTLNKVIDLQGNYYTIEYTEDTINGDYYPSQIAYTQNDSAPLTSYRTVTFTYVPRTDHCPLYIPSFVDMDQRLLWITVRIGNNLIRKYQLVYENGISTGRSRLIKIQEFGSDEATALPDSNFEWQEGDNSFVDNLWSAAGTGSSLQMPGDFNGDGKTDVAYFVAYQGWWVHESTGSSFTNKLWTGAGTGSSHQMSGDFNGDGKTDIAYYIANQGWRVLLSTGSSFTDSLWTNAGDGSSCQRTGDFNGDGKTDITYYIDNQGWRVLLSTGSSFTVSLWTNAGDGSSHRMTGDFNGDGKTDLVYYVDGQGWRVLKSTGDKFEAKYWAAGEGSSHQMTGDFNGDGKTDLIYYVDGQGWRVLKSTGDSWDAKYWLAGEGTSHQMTGDFNGDGKTDLLYYVSGKGWRVLKSTGDSWDANYWGGQDGFYQMTGDFNGDGKTDLVNFVDGQGFRVLLSSGLPNDLLKKITNSTGSIISISYLPAPQSPNAIIPSGKTYPNIADSSPRPLVTQIVLNNGFSQNNGLSQNITFNYTYSNGMVHQGYPYERSGLGFEWMKKIDANTNSYTITYYRQDDVDYSGRIHKKIQYGFNGLEYLEYLETQYQYDKRPNPNNGNIKFIYLTNEYIYNYNGETGTPVESRIAYSVYDNYGNLTDSTNYGDTITPTDDVRQTTEYYYYVNMYTYVVDHPAVERKYSPDLNGVTGLAGETRYFYTANYLLDYQELENGNQDITLRYGYDAYGNVTSFTDGRNNTSAIIYDTAYQTWVRYQTNPLNQTVETIYDSLMRPWKVIDANGAVTETQYDVFSREKAKILPGDDATYPTSRTTYWNEFIYVFAGQTKPIFPARQKTELKESGANFLEKYGYYDGLGRLIQEKSEAKTGWTTVDYLYDNSGRQWKTSMPYITGSYDYSSPDTAVKAKWIEYDPIGRVAAIHNSDDTIKRHYYAKYDTYTDDENNHLVCQSKVGNTVYDITYNGVNPNWTEYARTTTLIAYNGIRVTDAKGNIFTTSLDMLGRKTGENNPGMGAWSYGYDGNNNLTSRTDGKGQTVSILYDALNRPMEKDYPDGSKVNFYYDEDGHGYAKGQLTRLVYPAGSESYIYDIRGRKTSITQTIDGISKTQGMTYDSMDRVVDQTYPDGEVVTFGYEVDGNVKSVSGSSAYVSTIDYTALNKVSKIQYGNGVQTIYDYYDTTGELDTSAGTYFSYRLKGIQTSKSGTSILNLQYEYDKSDNVKVKRDLDNGSLTETYGYDAQNRLTSASAGVYGSKVYQYDQINNITQKDGRSYTYTISGKPYAVASDGQSSYTYDANGNMNSRNDIINWNFTSDTEGWTVLNQITGFGFQTGGYIGGNVTGPDPSLLSNSGLGLDITNNKTIKVKMKNSTASTLGQIYFITNQDQSWNEAKKKNFAIIANDPNYTEYTVDMSDVPGWNGTLYQLRMDPSTSVTSGSFSVEYINIVNLSRTFTWDYDSRVSSISDGGSFTYDVGFRRIKKVENGVTTMYFFDTYEEDYEGGILKKTSKFYFANNQRVAEQSSTNGLRYYHQDHLSSSSAITDASGNLVLRMTYQPYGGAAYSQGNASLKYQFTGKEKDGDGLYYYWARYYDPELGRFISPDPARDGMNWYEYCANNPVKYIDPTGLAWWNPFTWGKGQGETQTTTSTETTKDGTVTTTKDQVKNFFGEWITKTTTVSGTDNSGNTYEIKYFSSGDISATYNYNSLTKNEADAWNTEKNAKAGIESFKIKLATNGLSSIFPGITVAKTAFNALGWGIAGINLYKSIGPGGYNARAGDNMTLNIYIGGGFVTAGYNVTDKAGNHFSGTDTSYLGPVNPW